MKASGCAVIESAFRGVPLSLSVCVGGWVSGCDLGHRTISTGVVAEFVRPCNRIGMGGVWLYLFLGPGVQAMHQKLLDPGGLQ